MEPEEDFTFELDDSGKVIVTPQNDRAKAFLEEIFGAGCLSITMEEFSAALRADQPN